MIALTGLLNPSENPLRGGVATLATVLIPVKETQQVGSDSPMARFFRDRGCYSESCGERQGMIVIGGCWRLPLLPTPGDYGPCPVEAIRPEQ